MACALTLSFYNPIVKAKGMELEPFPTLGSFWAEWAQWQGIVQRIAQA